MGHVCSSTPFSCSHVGSQLYIYFKIYYPYKSTNHNHTNERVCACLSVTCTFGIMSEVLYIYIYSEREREGCYCHNTGPGVTNMQKPMLFRILHKINHLLKPHAFTVQKNPDMYHCMIVSYMTECVSIKGFKQSLLLCFCLSDVEVRSQLSKKINFDTCQTRSVVVSDGLLPTSVSGHITSFPTFICMWD